MLPYSNKSNAAKGALRFAAKTGKPHTVKHTDAGWIVVPVEASATEIAPGRVVNAPADSLTPETVLRGKTPQVAPIAGMTPLGAKPAPSTAAAADKGQGKRAAALSAAQTGQIPAAPDFSANTHKPYRAKLAALTALVTAGDVAGLEAFAINPTSSSPKALEKYRGLAVIALRVRQVMKDGASKATKKA